MLKSRTGKQLRMLNKGSTFSTRVFEWEKYVIKNEKYRE